MILRHVLSQFSKFISGDLKYFSDFTCYHSNYDFSSAFSLLYTVYNAFVKNVATCTDSFIAVSSVLNQCSDNFKSVLSFVLR